MSFNYFRSITIDHTKCGSSDTAGFPLLVSLSHATLKSVANGGHVESGSGYDVYFYSDATLTTRLPAERVAYDATNGIWKGWVKTTITNAASTVITMGYGDSGISTDPNNDATYGKTSVWDSNFKGVWHFNEDPSGSAPQLKDSTSTGANGTSRGSMTSGDLVAGLIDYGYDFDKTDDAVNCGTSSVFQFTNTATLEVIAKLGNTTTGWVLSKSSYGNKGYGIIGTVNNFSLYYGTGSGSGSYKILQNLSIIDSNYHYVVVTYSGGLHNTLTAPTYYTTHGAYATYNGKMYTFGGHIGNPASPVGYVQIWNGTTWTYGSSTGFTARWGCAACEIDGIIYVIGGNIDATTGTRVVQAYDVAGDSWSTKTQLPSALGAQGIACAAVNGKIIALYNNKIAIYDPGNDTWTSKADAGWQLGTWPACTTNGTYVYFIKSGRILRYDPTNDIWVIDWVTNVPYSAWAGVAQCYGGYIYYGFGRKGGGEAQSRELYKLNIATKIWTKLAPDTAEGNALFSSIISDKLYIFGQRALGKGELYASGYFSKFNLLTELWETTCGTALIFVDGIYESGLIETLALRASTEPLVIGDQSTAGGLPFGGVVDEAFVSNTKRSDDYILARGNNISNPGNIGAAGFYAISDEHSIAQLTIATDVSAAVSPGVVLGLIDPLSAGTDLISAVSPGVVLGLVGPLSAGTDLISAVSPGVVLGLVGHLSAGTDLISAVSPGVVLGLIDPLSAGTDLISAVSPGVVLGLVGPLSAGTDLISAVSPGVAITKETTNNQELLIEIEKIMRRCIATMG